MSSFQKYTRLVVPVNLKGHKLLLLSFAFSLCNWSTLFHTKLNTKYMTKKISRKKKKLKKDKKKRPTLPASYPAFFLLIHFTHPHFPREDICLHVCFQFFHKIFNYVLAFFFLYVYHSQSIFFSVLFFSGLI